MPLDTHAAFRELENGGFDAKQAEVLVQVINGSMGEHATKADVEGVKADIEGVKADVKELREALEKLREDVMAALKEQREEFKAALKEQGEDFKERFATKADVLATTNRNLFGTLAVAALLFTALQLFPLAS